MSEAPRKTYLLCGIPITISALAAAGIGTTLQLHSLLYQKHLDDLLGGKPLPMLTQWIFSVMKALPPLVGGPLLGAAILLAGWALLLSASNERDAKRRTLGYLIGVWLAALLGMGIVWLAFKMPLISIISGMKDS